MTKRLLFSSSVYQFLLVRGYTHIQLRGIEPGAEKERTAGNKDDYILVPWKEGMGIFEDTNFQLEKIDSTDVSDMLGVEFGINFWIELPEEAAAAYKKCEKSESK